MDCLAATEMVYLREEEEGPEYERDPHKDIPRQSHSRPLILAARRLYSRGQGHTSVVCSGGGCLISRSVGRKHPFTV